MQARDKTRAGMSKANPSEKTTLMKKYKILRNQVISCIRHDSLKFNEEYASAKNEIKKFVKTIHI